MDNIEQADMKEKIRKEGRRRTRKLNISHLIKGINIWVVLGDYS